MDLLCGDTKLPIWKQNKNWCDRFLPEIKQILGLHLIGEASTEDDCFKNTDLCVMKIEAIRIACRMRRFNYLIDYPGEFTIRTLVRSGGITEIGKIMTGWGNYFFYGFANELEEKILSWYLCDLNVFRYWFNKYLMEKGVPPGIEKPNGDGTKFRAFKLNELPQNFIIAGKKYNDPDQSEIPF